MRRSSVFLSAAGFIASGLVAVAVSAPAQAAPSGPSDPTPPQVARGIIVKAKTTSQARRTSIARTAASELPGDVGVASTDPVPGGLAVVALDEVVPVADLAGALSEVKARPDVEWAVADTLRFAASTPPVSVNDPGFTTQGNLWDTRSSIDGQATDGGFTTKAPALWRATKGSSQVVVAVVDTGITQHPDLAGQTVAGYDFVDDEYTCDDEGSCYYDGSYLNAGDGTGWDSNPSDPGDWLTAGMVTDCYGPVDDPADYASDSSWHGTHVAGTVAAKANNATGVAGVAPGVKVQPVRVLGHCGGWDSDIYFAIRWSAGDDLRRFGVPLNRTPARVINLSLGSEYGPGEDVDSNGIADRDEACSFYAEAASFARSRGTVVVAAAGNSSYTSVAPLSQSVPASCPGYFSVTATSDTGHRAWYSTAGAGSDISAPGGDQNVGSYDTARGILSTLNSGTRGPAAPIYERYDGTSMATPAVAAGAALLYSLGFADPATVETKLKASVQPYSTVSYGPTKIYGPQGLGFTTTNTSPLNCHPAVTPRVDCGAGILDLSKVTAPLGGPRVSAGTLTPGRTLTATSRGLTTAGTSAITWWRGSTKVSSSATYRLTAADLGRTLEVRDTVASGTYAGARMSTTVRVPKVRSTVSFATPSRVSASKRAKVKVRVIAPYAAPTGTIRIYDGKRRIATKSLSAGARGKVTITLPKLKRGKHRISVVYLGSSQVERSTSRARIIRSR